MDGTQESSNWPKPSRRCKNKDSGTPKLVSHTELSKPEPNKLVDVRVLLKKLPENIQSTVNLSQLNSIFINSNLKKPDETGNLSSPINEDKISPITNITRSSLRSNFKDKSFSKNVFEENLITTTTLSLGEQEKLTNISEGSKKVNFDTVEIFHAPKKRKTVSPISINDKNKNEAALSSHNKITKKENSETFVDASKKNIESLPRSSQTVTENCASSSEEIVTSTGSEQLKQFTKEPADDDTNELEVPASTFIKDNVTSLSVKAGPQLALNLTTSETKLAIKINGKNISDSSTSSSSAKESLEDNIVTYVDNTSERTPVTNAQELKSNSITEEHLLNSKNSEKVTNSLKQPLIDKSESNLPDLLKEDETIIRNEQPSTSSNNHKYIHNNEKKCNEEAIVNVFKIPNGTPPKNLKKIDLNKTTVIKTKMKGAEEIPKKFNGSVMSPTIGPTDKDNSISQESNSQEMQTSSSKITSQILNNLILIKDNQNLLTSNNKNDITNTICKLTCSQLEQQESSSKTIPIPLNSNNELNDETSDILINKKKRKSSEAKLDADFHSFSNEQTVDASKKDQLICGSQSHSGLSNSETINLNSKVSKNPSLTTFDSIADKCNGSKSLNNMLSHSENQICCNTPKSGKKVSKKMRGGRNLSSVETPNKRNQNRESNFRDRKTKSHTSKSPTESFRSKLRSSSSPKGNTLTLSPHSNSTSSLEVVSTSKKSSNLKNSKNAIPNELTAGNQESSSISTDIVEHVSEFATELRKLDNTTVVALNDYKNSINCLYELNHELKSIIPKDYLNRKGQPEHPPQWFLKFIAHFRKQELWRLHQLFKIHDHFMRVESAKLNVLENVLENLKEN